jgi:C-terminal processing protease CtpA/Prc
VALNTALGSNGSASFTNGQLSIAATGSNGVVVQDNAQVQDSTTGNVQTLTHESVTTIQGEYQTRYEPQVVETYDHVASYWRKAQPPVLGILGSDLEEADRQAQQSNKGVLVKLLVRNSPAFMADVFRGDIVRKLAGHEVLGTEDFFQRVAENAGKTVDLQLWRNGKLITKSVTLAQR